jgi:hypothetical protein
MLLWLFVLLLLSLCFIFCCCSLSSLYCMLFFMFPPISPSPYMQVVCLRKLLFCFFIVIAFSSFFVLLPCTGLFVVRLGYISVLVVFLFVFILGWSNVAYGFVGFSFDRGVAVLEVFVLLYLQHPAWRSAVVVIRGTAFRDVCVGT